MKKIQLLTIFIFVVTALSLIGCMSSNDPATGGACGVVVDSAGKPISGVTVSAQGKTSVTDYYGKWNIEPLQPEITNFIASKENYISQTKTYEVPSNTILENLNFALSDDGEIFHIIVSDVTSTKATISFQTKYEASTEVAYGSNASMDKTQRSSSSHKYNHLFNLTGLLPSTTYVFQCIATDKYNRKLTSVTNTFTTSPSSRGEAPANLTIKKVTGNAAFELSWNADASADFAGYNVYRATSEGSVFEKVNVGLVKQASYADMGIKVGEKYYYKVTRVSGNGDESPASNLVSMVMPGIINTNVVWKAEGSPYKLSGDLTIAQGASLIINKGTEVIVTNSDRWDNDSDGIDKIDISVYGTLLVQGTESQPVTIGSAENAPQNGDWAGIVFKKQADLTASSLKGLNIQFATAGVSGEVGLPTISYCNFINCSLAGIEALGSTKDVAISDCKFISCTTGINASDCQGSVEISYNQFEKCSYAIKALNNEFNQIYGNRIKANIIAAIELDAKDSASMTSHNTIGWGTSGIGIICNGLDEIRRNTIQADLGIQVKDTATAYIRSNLFLSDKDRNSKGVLFASDKTSSSNIYIQNNAVWNQDSLAAKYSNSNGVALVVTGDLPFGSLGGPALQGGDPFTTALTDPSFSYVPNAGSPLKGAGYDSYEDIGAEDVPH